VRKYIYGAIALSLFLLPWMLHEAPSEQASISSRTERASSVSPAGPAPAFILFEEAFAIEEERVAVEFRVQSEAAYAKLVDEELGRQAYAEAIQQELARRPKAAAPTYHPGATDGECSGFSIPYYIIQRESGGNPSAYNPSGAYGCAQTLLSHYSRGQCQGLDPYTIEGQRECVWRLSNGGTNLNPWAATR
jgi:Transglycosylase SLT domain